MPSTTSGDTMTDAADPVAGIDEQITDAPAFLSDQKVIAFVN